MCSVAFSSFETSLSWQQKQRCNSSASLPLFSCGGGGPEPALLYMDHLSGYYWVNLLVKNGKFAFIPGRNSLQHGHKVTWFPLHEIARKMGSILKVTAMALADLLTESGPHSTHVKMSASEGHPSNWQYVKVKGGEFHMNLEKWVELFLVMKDPIKHTLLRCGVILLNHLPGHWFYMSNMNCGWTKSPSEESCRFCWCLRIAGLTSVSLTSCSVAQNLEAARHFV